MRNLKRALSLVLASAMLIGMMVFGASAAGYKDNDAVNNDAAVEILSALGIVGGDENGNFRPASTLTRAEYCVMIANVLTGGKFDKTLFEGTGTPFTDVAGHWGAPFIAFCYSAGVIAGTTATTFSPDATLTAAQAEAILLSALGYNKNGEFAVNDQFELNVTTWAQRVGLMKDLSVAANAGITRDNTAQLMFNAMTNAVPVEYNDSFGVYYNALGRGTDWFAGVQFRYNESMAFTNFNLVYDSTAEDPFGRYATEWGTGTLLTDDPLDDNGNIAAGRGNVQNPIITVPNAAELTYTTAVKEGTIYKALGLKADNTIEKYVDGVAVPNIRLANDNNKDLADSGTGVLTEVYRTTNAAGVDEYRIVIINTYLARVTADYNENREELSIEVYPDGENSVRRIYLDDVGSIVNYKADDMILVQIADGKVVNILTPEKIEDAAISKFSTNGNPTKVTTGGVEYESAEKLYNPDEVLQLYNQNQLKDNTYDLYLDQYGYMIGIYLHTGTDNYLFLVGMDFGQSALSNRTADAFVIFTDGTTDTIQVNVKASDDENHLNGALEAACYQPYEDDYYNNTPDFNNWYRYTEDNGVYTLNTLSSSSATAVTELATTAGRELSTENVRVVEGTEYGYGNDNSVYITVKASKGATDEGDAIDEVTGVFTGAQTVTIKCTNTADANSLKKHSGETAPAPWDEVVWALVDRDNYIISAVIWGEDTGSANDNIVYGLKGAQSESYSDGYYYWDFQAVVDGHIETLSVKTKYEDTIEAIQAALPTTSTDGDGRYVGNVTTDSADGNTYENAALLKLTFDQDGYVTDAEVLKDVANLNPNGTVYGWGDVATVPVANLDPAVYSSYMMKYDPAGNTNGNGIEGMLRGTARTLQSDSAKDVGLTLASGAPVVVIQPDVNGKLSIEEYASVTAALKAIELAPNDKFDGIVAAALDNRGTAKWIVIESSTPLTGKGNTVLPVGDLSIYRVEYDAESLKVVLWNDADDVQASSAEGYSARVTVSHVSDPGNYARYGRLTAGRAGEGYITVNGGELNDRYDAYVELYKGNTLVDSGYFPVVAGTGTDAGSGS